MQSILPSSARQNVLWLVMVHALCIGQSLEKITVLPSVTISSNRGEMYKAGYKISSIDSTSLLLVSNLGDALQQNSNAYIKSYGVGNISTISLRGGGASHTATLWNGFNIQNSLNGLSDFSLIPTGILSSVNIQSGGSGALFGSGAIGGTIHLIDEASFKKEFYSKINYIQSSYNTSQLFGKINISSNRSHFSVSLYTNGGINNYPFVNHNLIEKPIHFQQHSAFFQKGISSSFHFKLSQNMQLSFWLWAQKNDRQIAPTLSSGRSVATQFDQFVRPALHLSIRKGSKQLNTRIALFNDHLNYLDYLKNIDSKFQVTNLIMEVDGAKKINKNLELNVGINHTYITGKSENYTTDKKIQSRFALFSAVKLKLLDNRLLINFSLRKEVADKIVLPSTPGLSFEYYLSQKWNISGNVSKNYRIPSFNDLYWKHGGNPSLRPENGWSQEIGLSFKSKSGLIQHEHKVSVFNRIVNDWLIWLPDDGIWTPNNLQKVWSRGLEYDIQLKWKIGIMQWKHKLMYAYTLSTNEKGKIVDDQSLGKQLIYVPLHKTNAINTIHVKSFILRHNFTYVGWRYISSDNISFLDPYSLHDLSLIYKSKSLRNFQTDLFLSVNNLLNVSYLAIADVPMPLRNYQLGVSIHFKKKQNNDESF